MKTNYFLLLILCFSLTLLYAQPNQSTAKSSISTSKKTIPVIVVLKPFTELGDLWGYKNAATGNVVIEPIYFEAFPFNNGLALVKTEELKYGFINMKGEEIIPFIYDCGFPFSEGLAALNSGKGFDENENFSSGKWGYVDNKGNQQIKFKFSDAKSFSQGLAAIQVEEKWGFIDKTGNVIISLKYIDALSFSEGLAMVRNDNGKWGYIDKIGKTIIPFRFDFGQSFENGKAEVEINGKSFFVNKKGERI